MHDETASGMDDEWFRGFAGRARWVFARTMPDAPHWYTLRADHLEADFVRAVLDIRRHGFTRWYRGRAYTCYQLDGMIYWTMGAPVEETVLINRAHAS